MPPSTAPSGIDDRVASRLGRRRATRRQPDFAAALGTAADVGTLCAAPGASGPAATALAGVESAEASIGGGANGLDFLDGFAELSATIATRARYSNNTAEVV